MNRIVIIVSTGGAVLSKVLEVQEVKEMIQLVVSDRQCGAIKLAEKHGIPTMIIESQNGNDFSKKLVDFFGKHEVGLFISFYTRLLSQCFLSRFENRVLNFHPSILPACPGMDGFGDTIRSGSKFIGATVHFVDEGMDTGKPLIQSCYPLDHTKSISENRHRVFVQQCKMLIQISQWFKFNRIYGQDILNAKYEFSEFNPNLDSELALEFKL